MTIALLIATLASLGACIFFFLHGKKKKSSGLQSELAPAKKRKWNFVKKYALTFVSGMLVLAGVITMIYLYCTMHGTFGMYGDNVKWTYYDGVLTIYGQGPMADAEHGNYPKWRKWSDRIEEIVIEEGVTSIGVNTFRNVQCKRLSIADSVTEVDVNGLPADGYLEEIKLSSNCDSYYLGCSTLTEVQFGENTKRVALGWNSGCRMLENLEFPMGTKEIHGFSYCKKLEDLDFPDSVKIISGFEHCDNLKNLTLPEGLTSISGFDGCKRLEELVFPRCVEKVSGFNGCTSLDSIVFPEELKSITEGSFAFCYELKSITFLGDLPEGLETDLADFFPAEVIFVDSVATVYYPKDNPTWENLDRSLFGKGITFVGV